MNAVMPTVTEVVDSLIGTLRTEIRPAVADPYASSLLLTIENLLRHIGWRAEIEAELMFEDNADLAAVLRMVAGERTVAMPEPANDTYPSPMRLRERAVLLRGRLDDLLRAGGDAAVEGSAFETAVHGYFARAGKRAAQLIEPAFTTDRR